MVEMTTAVSGMIIIGIGNPYRGDDAAGWAVIDGLKEIACPAIKLVKQKGDIVELLEILANYKSVYMVDACRNSDLADAWQRIDVHLQPIPPDNPQTSTHGFSISQAIALAKNLDQLPNRLILYAIAGENYSISSQLSPSVVKSIDSVIKAILNEEEIQLCMNKA